MDTPARIWITRKARIEAATRLELNAHYSNFYIAYYAVFSIIFSILDIRNTEKDYSYQLLIASVITLSVSLYLPGMQFKERAVALKECYVRLSGLYRRAKKASAASSIEGTLEVVEQEYEDFLVKYENQASGDYYLAKFRLRGKDAEFDLTWGELFELFLFKLRRLTAIAILSLIPFYLLYCFQP